MWYASVWCVRYVNIPQNVDHKMQSQKTTVLGVHLNVSRQTVGQNMPNSFNKCQTGWKNRKVLSSLVLNNVKQRFFCQHHWKRPRTC